MWQHREQSVYTLFLLFIMPCNCFHYVTTQLMNKFNLWYTEYLAHSWGHFTPNGRQQLCNMRVYLPGNRLQHLFKSEKSKKTHPKLQLSPALPSNENLEEAELLVLGPSYNTCMKSTKFKAVAYKLFLSSSDTLPPHLLACKGPQDCAVNILTGLWLLEFCHESSPRLCRQWSSSLGQNSCTRLLTQCLTSCSSVCCFSDDATKACTGITKERKRE